MADFEDFPTASFEDFPEAIQTGTASIETKPKQKFLELTELTGDTPETTPSQGIAGKFLDFIQRVGAVSPFVTERGSQGQPVYPTPTVRDEEALKKAAATGLEVGGAFLAPELLGGTALAGRAAEAPFAIRSLVNALSGTQAALGGAGGRLASRAVGLSESLSENPEEALKQEFDIVKKEAAFGALTPIGIDAGFSLLKKTAGGLSSFLNSDARIARMFGAKNKDLHDDAQKFLIQKIANLKDDPEFASRVISAPTIKRSADAAQDMLEKAGQEISAFQKANKNLKATSGDILSSSFYDELVDAATNPAIPKTDRAIAQRVLNDFESTLPEGFLQGNKEISLESLLTSRRAFDKKVEKGFYAKQSGDITPRFELYKKAADAYRDIINKTAPELKELNERFSELSPVVSILKNGKAGVAGKVPLLDESIGITDALKGIGLVGVGVYGGPGVLAGAAGLAGLSTNPGRALAFQLSRTQTPGFVGQALPGATVATRSLFGNRPEDEIAQALGGQ